MNPTAGPNDLDKASQSDVLPGQASASNDLLLDQIVDEITRKLQQGESVSLLPYQERYPELADRLRQLWPGLQLLAELSDWQDPADVSSMGGPSGSVDPARHRLGDFHILRQAGRGGMGVVYEAEELSLGRRVALKVLPQVGLLDQRQLQRFRNEARAAAGLHHAHIVPVYSVGCDRGVHYYAMQFIEGSSLAELIVEMRHQSNSLLPGPLATEQALLSATHLAGRGEAAGHFQGTAVSPIPELPKSEQAAHDTRPQAADRTDRVYGNAQWFRSVARMGIELAEALEYAHSLGVVHRDIKPANIMMDLLGATWITDFGLAQLESDAGLTMTGDVLGTLRYMSPEQARGQRGAIDHRTDIYSLGLTLYELLTLQPAFSSSDRRVLLKQVLEDAPPSPRTINRSIPYDLETVLLKAMEKSPSGRYASAQELADDLQRFLSLRPVQARRPTLAERATKWSHRHWAAVTTAAAVLLLAVVAAAGLKLQSDRRTRDVADAVRTSIAVTRTAIEADDLKLAGQKLSEAEGNLRLSTARLPELAEAIDELHGELDRREQDAERFVRLIELARDAQDKMTHAEYLGGEQVAEEALALLVVSRNDWRTLLEVATSEAQQAVALAGVLADDNWLEGGALPDEQQRQVRETIYETLLCLADFGVRWPNQRSEERSRASLEYLELASLFHEPTRGFYWVRAKCQAHLGDEEAAVADRQRYVQTPAFIALDHYLPGHTDGWGGDLDRAILAYRAALSLQPDNYNAMFFLGQRLATQKRFEEAALAYRACMALRPLATDVHWNCADALRQLLRFDEGEQVLVNGLERARQKLGKNHPETVQAMSRLAWWYKSRGDYGAAEPLMLDVLQARRETLGDEHRYTIISADGLARVYLNQSRYAESERLFMYVLEMRRHALSDEHSDTLTSINDLAGLYTNQGRYGEAEKNYLQLVETTRRVFGDGHEFTLNRVANMANLYRCQGRCAEAETLYVKTLETQLRVLGESRQFTLVSMVGLGLTYYDQHRYDDSDALLINALAGRRKVLGDHHRVTLRTMDHLARVYLRLQRYADAEQLLRDRLAIEVPAAKESWEQAHAETLLGAALFGLEQFDEAQERLLAGLQAMESLQDRMPYEARTFMAEAAEQLAKLREAAKQQP